MAIAHVFAVGDYVYCVGQEAGVNVKGREKVDWTLAIRQRV